MKKDIPKRLLNGKKTKVKISSPDLHCRAICQNHSTVNLFTFHGRSLGSDFSIQTGRHNFRQLSLKICGFSQRISTDFISNERVFFSLQFKTKIKQNNHVIWK